MIVEMPNNGNPKAMLDRIEQVFGWRKKPAQLVQDSNQSSLDFDINEALWFAGHDWHELTWQDWQTRSEAIIFMTQEAFAYYLPSILGLSVQRPNEPLAPAQSLIWELDRTPGVENWDVYLTDRFLALRVEELEVLKEWLVQVCEYPVYRGFRNAAAGAGEILGRAFDTVDLLQKEVAQRHLKSS